MRCMRRNKVEICFALFDHKTETEDEYGNKTGEQTLYYQDPVKTRANVSTAKNQDSIQIFGTDIPYDKVIVMDKPCPVDENTVFWIDTLPELDDEGKTETPYDYIVKKVAGSLNSVTIAVSKVKVRHGE